MAAPFLTMAAPYLALAALYLALAALYLPISAPSLAISALYLALAATFLALAARFGSVPDSADASEGKLLAAAMSLTSLGPNPNGDSHRATPETAVEVPIPGTPSPSH